MREQSLINDRRREFHESHICTSLLFVCFLGGHIIQYTADFLFSKIEKMETIFERGEEGKYNYVSHWYFHRNNIKLQKGWIKLKCKI